jgi:flagellar protein FliS
MNPAQFAKSYRSVAVTTASPGQLVLMLYDGALRFLATAARGFECDSLAERFETINNNLLKSQAILRELQTSLDLKAGGEFAQTMWALYDFMMDQLRQANMRKQVEPIQTVEGLILELRGAWSQMLEQTSAEAA